MTPFAFKFTHAAVAVLVIVRLETVAAPVRVSFLTESPPLLDTIQMLRSSDCSEAGIQAFQRAAAQQYAIVPFDFDFKKFPEGNVGFYTFDSSAALVAALPHRVCDTPGEITLNCFDAVITLVAESMRTSTRPDDLAGPFLVPFTLTNRCAFEPKATARDAFHFMHAQGYGEQADTRLPQGQRDMRVSLTAELVACYVLPQSAVEERLPEATLEVLKASWKSHRLKFPTRYEIVLCHQLDFPHRMLSTTHTGLLLPRKHGYTYIEKSSASGPFVRIDLASKADLIPWFRKICTGQKRFGFTHHFATFNDTKIELLLKE